MPRRFVLGCGLLNRVAVGALITAMTASASAFDAKDEAIQKDRNRIKGTWRIIVLVADGNTAMEADARKLTVVNGSDGTWSLRSEGKEISKGISNFDPTKSPKTIDFTPTEGEAKGDQFLGIYELGENTRKMCFAPVGKMRPSDFSSSPGSGHICVTFEREKTD
jgi:uncharacterized protein (TIGR03067 family)